MSQGSADHGVCSIGNYDITKLHYEGPGADVRGATAGGYGYDVRIASTAAAAA